MPIIPGSLNVYNILNPSSPTLIPGSQLAVSGVDIRVIPEDEKLLLIQGQKILVYDYQGATTLTQICESESLAGDALSVAPCGTEPARVVKGLGRAVVQVDGATRRVFLTCGIQHERVPEELFKGAGIIALDLTGYPPTPTFYGYVFDAYPCPAPADPYADPPKDWAVVDLALTKQGSNWFLCAVGAHEQQLKVFRVTDFPTSGFQYFASKDTWSGSIKDDLVAVKVVGSNVAALGRNFFFVAALFDLNEDDFRNELFGDGPRGDTVLMLEGSPTMTEDKLINVSGNTGSDYKFKVMDVPKMGKIVGQWTPERRYAAGGTDAAIYIPEYASVYATCFNGLVRYDVSNPPDAIPDDDSYLPASDPAIPNSLYVIEHMIGVQSRGASSGRRGAGSSLDKPPSAASPSGA